MLVLRNVRPWGKDQVDVAMAEGRIIAIGTGLPPGNQEIDGKGHVLLPGIHDHHLHLLALATRRQSVSLARMESEAQVATALRNAESPFPRAIDYDERAAGLPDASMLDRWLPDRPVRLADRTGALWVLNSPALHRIAHLPPPAGAERNAAGQLTGRFWREDRWLRQALGTVPPEIAPLGRELAALGITGLTDATAHNGPEEAALLTNQLPQRLVLMGSEMLRAGKGYILGPLKLMLDERELPELEACAGRIVAARMQGRAVAAHCVTEGELAFYLAALDLAGGARTGDRVEHGALIASAWASLLAEKGLTVVTNPAFIHDRGSRYLSELSPDKWDHLYPAARLLRAGVPLLVGSDAPYAAIDPWKGMRAMRDRLTAQGVPLGPNQRLEAQTVLQLFCPGTVAIGASADLLVCEGSLGEVMTDLSAERLRLTLIGGVVAYQASSPA